MTAGSLPEGLVERCAEAMVSRAGRDPESMRAHFPAQWYAAVEDARSVLAVAAPALRAAALRERDELAQLVRDTWRPCVYCGPRTAIPRDSCTHCVATAELQRRVGP